MTKIESYTADENTVPKPNGTYIKEAIEAYCLNGDSYIPEDKLFTLCSRKRKKRKGLLVEKTLMKCSRLAV